MDSQAASVDSTVLTLLPKEKQQELEEIPRQIHQAATKQKIGAMGEDEVLCVAITQENFKELNLDFHSFLAVIHEGNNENILFIMQHVMQNEFASILSQYYEQHLCPIFVIEVEDHYDFNDLVVKSGVGAGTGKRNYCTRANLVGNTYQDFVSHIEYITVWHTLDRRKLELAWRHIPKQAEGWSCGPNSAARALILTGENHDFRLSGKRWHKGGYSVFLKHCPLATDIAKYNYKIATKTEFGAAIPESKWMIDPPGACKFRASAYRPSTMGCLETPDQVNPISIGPSPYCLSDYINLHLPFPRNSKVCCYDSFENCAKAISHDIREGDPVIAFFLYGPTTWHYANIVATQRMGNYEKFMKLETNSTFEWLDYTDMADLMRNDYGFLTYFGCKGDIGRFTIIRFSNW